MATRVSEKDDVMKSGRMESILRQYSKKARDFQRPWTATTSGGTPLRRSSVAPPILKQWPISLQRLMNQERVMGDHPPLTVSKANKGAWLGTIAFAEIWWSRAVTGFVRSLTWDKIIFAPLPRVVLVQGMWNTDQETPFTGLLREIVVDRAT
ncbi:hypothetical protein P692DRAFT_201803655 [Suillus brevipes Sb2]|nr:hypothetical protein P692DRAFT_201803655 [Suillus brevipes Sb2]